MLLVKVELHSAVTGQVTEIARMKIVNVGGTLQLGHYDGEVFKGRDTVSLRRGTVHRRGHISGHHRLRRHVWHLVVKMLSNMGYGK